MTKRYLLVLLMLAVVAAIAVGCGEEASTTTASTATGDTTAAIATSVLANPQGYPADPSLTPELGGTLQMILGMSLGNFGEPWGHMPGPNAYACRAVCEPLVTIGPDGERAPCLATEWVKDADALTYTFTLREGVSFQDGTPFNAEAVVWNLEKGAAEGVAALQGTTAEATGEYTVVLTLTNWDEILLERLGDSGMMVSPAAYAELGDLKTHPVGTGPFMFDDFVADSSIDLVANPDYWQEGLPYLDGIHIDMVTDATVRFAAFMNGECDYLEGASGQQVAEAEAAGFESLFMVSGIIGLTWDSTSADSPFADPNVRKAMAMAVDYRTIVDNVFAGMYPTTNQFAGSLDGTDLQGWNADIAGYGYDQAAALEMLTAAGYGLDNPINVKLNYPQQAEKNDQYAAVQAELAKVGINITELMTYDNAGWGQAILNQVAGELYEWQVGYQLSTPYIRSLDDSLSVRKAWFPLQATTPEFDALYNEMLVETDAAAKADLYKQLNAQAVADCLAIPLYLRVNYKLIGANTHDMGAGQWAGEYDPSIIWLSK